MTDAADLVLTNGEVHTLTDPDETAEAIAVRDGEIVRVGSAYEIDFLAGVDTRTIDLDGHVLLPGFIDAHTHMEELGKRLVHADLADATSPDEAIEALGERADELDSDEENRGWILGFGYDESAWDESRYLDRTDLDRVSETRPVVAFREDMHTASVNGVTLDRLGDRLPQGDVRTENGDPTGVLVEDALGPVRAATAPGRAATRDLLLAAQEYANELGVTGVHDMVRGSHAPRVYRDLDSAGEITLRVRINYWSDHLDATIETGLATNHGSEFVRTGAIKTFTDGSIGARTAKLTEPYADASGGDADGKTTGQWVVPPAELHELVERADDAGFQVTAHAIGDRAVDEVLDTYAATDDPGSARHRIEHAELPFNGAIDRFADTGIVASVQPNFLKWADEGGLYDTKLGDNRRRRSNPLRELHDAGVRLAFGSDCMPLDPLLGVHHAVNAPVDAQRLPVTDALRAYTHGAAYAGFDEDRLGTIEPGKRADLVALDRSPWDQPGEVEDIDVAATIVDGEIVHDAR
ncbi:amidohydrolase [Halococcus saccharolyticus]|uniref:Amidohydrolase 3 n=1 Tax=Halococcus saccharolyticus DSM 5350 TaxID=1227455 RepID=M0MF57_9EURY|nr:amidohydrolase [Halococcus saccharolyticus]EMA43324.1 Amidohydrolase 3 [Halococcus saccharolyticus DSM 5350]